MLPSYRSETSTATAPSGFTASAGCNAALFFVVRRVCGSFLGLLACPEGVADCEAGLFGDGLGLVLLDLVALLFGLQLLAGLAGRERHLALVGPHVEHLDL